MQRRCECTTKSGKACRGFALPDSQFCVAHCPDYREQRKRDQRSGGLAKSNSARAAKRWQQLADGIEPEKIPGLLVAAGLAALEGEIEPRRVSAFAQAVRASVQVSEAVAFDARLRELESLLRRLETNRE